MPGVEFNFYIDPEANYIVFNGTEYRENTIMILPWEAILSTKITMVQKIQQKSNGLICSQF